MRATEAGVAPFALLTQSRRTGNPLAKQVRSILPNFRNSSFPSLLLHLHGRVESGVRGVSTYLHEDDRQWVQRPDGSIKFWQGETYSLERGLTLIRVGGNFPGFQVLHSVEAENGQGALFSGDQPQVCPDMRYVSFMYSYPNFVPLDAASVRRIVSMLEPFSFTKLYGAWPNFVVQGHAKEALRRSAERYLRSLEGSPSMMDLHAPS
jgi:hypothetical protein